MLTVKSDDVSGRVDTFEAIVKGKNVPKPGIPESFKVLVKELQSLGLDVKVLAKDNSEIDISTSIDDENEEIGLTPKVSDYKDVMNDTSVDFDEEFDDESDDDYMEDSDVLDGVYDPLEDETTEDDVLDY